MDLKPLPHPFFNGPTINTQGILGYQKCLEALFGHIKEKTHLDPGKRYIDSVELLDRAQLTLGELKGLLERAEMALQGQLNRN